MNKLDFEMSYKLKDIEEIKNGLFNNNDNFDYEKFGDLATLCDKNFGSSLYLGGYVCDKKLSITWSKHFGKWEDNDYENLYCNLVDWEEINSVGKLKKYMVKMLKYYNNLYNNRKEVK